MYKILIIEDDPDQVLMYATKLRLDGFEVYVGNGGEEGIKLAKLHKPDLILLDLIMSQLSGLETLEALKKDEETKDCQVIIFSNLDQKGIVEKVVNMGALDFWHKIEFLPSSLSLRIKDLLKKSNKKKTKIS